MEGNSHFTRARANQKSYQLKFFSKSKLHKVLINQAFTYCFNFLHHFLKQKASVPLVISPQFSKRWQLGVGGIPPRLGLTAGFPAMPSAKKKKPNKEKPTKKQPPEQKQERDYCAFNNSLKNNNNKTKQKPQQPPTKNQHKNNHNPNTPTPLIHLWAKTTQKKTNCKLD